MQYLDTHFERSDDRVPRATYRGRHGPEARRKLAHGMAIPGPASGREC